jgi:dissimilatory sulfite reductase (desulfoviridin) alpha/beta subunit
VEIPGVKRGDLEKLQELLAAAGTENVQLGPKARTVTACQGLDVCKWGCVSTYSLAVELTGRYYGRPLPAKFKIGVTGCRNNCLKIEENDVGIKGAMLVELERGLCQGCGACVKACRARALAAPGDGEAPAIDRAKCLSCGRCVKVCPDGAWTGRPAYEVYFGGNFGNGSSVGRALLPLVESREALVKAIDAAVDFYQANGKPGQRFRAVAEQAGWDSLAKAAASAAGL